MAQYPAQASPVDLEYPLKNPLAAAIEPAVLFLLDRPQELCAHHGSGCERNQQRDRNRGAQHHRELAEQPAYQPRHKQYGNEHRNQRGAHREHREAYLPRTSKSRAHRIHALLEITRDVLEHHNGVIHYKARRDGERHQRQVVDAVPHQIHSAKGGNQ